MSFDFDFELDRTFYLIGLIIGASRRVASKVPHEVKNFGKQPNIDWTENRIKSLAIGIMVGHNYIFECKTIKTNVTQNQNPLIAYKDMISITVPTKYVSQGDSVTLPVILSRQAKEKFGTKQFQLVLGYNSSYLTCTKVESSEPWVENFAYDIQAGQVIVQGGRPTPHKDDTTLCYLTFKVADHASGTLPLKIVGSPGTGLGTELLVVKEDNELYYITPVNYENGALVLDEEPVENTVIGSNSTTMEGSSYVGNGGSYIDYNFSASFDVADGVTLSGGVHTIINIYLNGNLIGTSKVPLQQGNHNYSGSIELDKLEPMREGEITVETKIECENPEDAGFVYVYLKAGALFSLVTKVTDEEVREGVPPERIKRNLKDYFKIIDFVDFTRVSSSVDPVNLIIEDTLGIITDSTNHCILQVAQEDGVEGMHITDDVIFKHYNPDAGKEPIIISIADTIKIAQEVIDEVLTSIEKESSEGMQITDDVIFIKRE